METRRQSRKRREGKSNSGRPEGIIPTVAMPWTPNELAKISRMERITITKSMGFSGAIFCPYN